MGRSPVGGAATVTGLLVAHTLVVVPIGGRPVADNVTYLPPLVLVVALLGVVAVQLLDVKPQSIAVLNACLAALNVAVVVVARVQGEWDLMPPAPLIVMAAAVYTTWPQPAPLRPVGATHGEALDTAALDAAKRRARDAERRAAELEAAQAERDEREKRRATELKAAAAERDEREKRHAADLAAVHAQLAEARRTIANADATVADWWLPVGPLDEADRSGSGCKILRGIDTRTGEDTVGKIFPFAEMDTHSTAGREYLAMRHLLNKEPHPNIIRVIACEDVAGDVYIIMELAEQSLRHFIRMTDSVTVRRAIQLLIEILTGLEWLHQQDPKALHLDLKPANILLVRTDAGLVAKISDFGITRWTRGSAVPGAYGRSVWYSAPEQWDPRAELDVRTDLYAAGAILHALVCGSGPFQAYKPPGADERVWMQSLVAARATLPAPTRLNPHIPAELAERICRWLSARPEDRPASAAEARNELETLLDAVPANLKVDLARMRSRRIVDDERPTETDETSTKADLSQTIPGGLR